MHFLTHWHEWEQFTPIADACCERTTRGLVLNSWMPCLLIRRLLTSASAGVLVFVGACMHVSQYAS